jgi:hypothetical protein
MTQSTPETLAPPMCRGRRLIWLSPDGGQYLLADHDRLLARPRNVAEPGACSRVRQLLARDRSIARRVLGHVRGHRVPLGVRRG